jgi:hypothetical protein
MLARSTVAHLDPGLYGAAATVIPVFWLGLLYQVNAYDLTTRKKQTNSFALLSIVVVTLSAVFGEIHALGALFDTRLAASARQPVAQGLYVPGALLFALPAWRMAAREAESTASTVVIALIFMGALGYGSYYVSTHV